MKKALLLLALTAITFAVSGADTTVKICILGSCSGTEPIPGRHQTAVTLETQGKLYQFDAGENCAYTAFTNKIDLLNLQAIFFSHPHFDHVGGFAHLLWTRGKIASRYKRRPAVYPLPVYTPVPAQIEAIINSLSISAKAKQKDKNSVTIHAITQAGVIYDDGTIKVEALRNRHCKPLADGTWLSYSFRITTGNKKIIYSGDIKNIDELAPFMDECDMLLVETGHHHPWEIAKRIRSNSKWHVRKLVFMHHGRDILNAPAESMRKTAEAWGSEPLFATDAMFLEL